MKIKIILILISLLIPFQSSQAMMKMPNPPDKVIYHVSAEQWVTTNTANVIVQINATLDKAGLDKARNQILLNLQRISKGEWHITRFDRTQDNSGLERLTVEAQSRLAQSHLGDLRDNAKQVSHPGSTYTISQIDFTPSLTEVETQREKLRQQLYQQAKAELARLNAVYPLQHFTLHLLNFIPGLMQPQQKAERFQLMAMAESAAPSVPPIEVSNKISMTALAVFATEKPQKMEEVG